MIELTLAPTAASVSSRLGCLLACQSANDMFDSVAFTKTCNIMTDSGGPNLAFLMFGVYGTLQLSSSGIV